MNSDTRNPAAGGPGHVSVFIWLFAIASIWHYTSSGRELLDFWARFDPTVTPLIAIAIVTAFIGALFPTRTPAVLLFAAGQVVAIFGRLPFVADHLVMELGLNLSILLAYGYLAIRRRTLAVPTGDMFELFGPIGRWLLIVMYFFGTFHKINPGFLSPESSCAIPFIMGFPLPGGFLGHPLVQYTAIYGTLALEAAAMLLLLSARTKYFGMLLGMPFHLIIGISGFGTLAHFSAFALALHTLFLPSTVGQRLYADPWVPAFMKSADAFRILTIIVVALQVLSALHLLRTFDGYLVNSLFAAYAIALMAIVLRHGRIRSDDAPYRLRSPLLAMNLVPVWFFLHCTSPYLGLGTGGALAMFSGLRTEGGVTNHYVIREPLQIFGYQDKLIYLESASNPSLAYAVEHGQGLVMFDFQRHFMYRETLVLPLTLVVDGERYELTDPESVSAFAGEHFTHQSWLERKYMSFRLVDDLRPGRCRH
jgi:hypothetical protein